MKKDIEEESEYNIYRCLDKFADQEIELQQHLYQKCKQFGYTDEKACFYDNHF